MSNLIFTLEENLNNINVLRTHRLFSDYSKVVTSGFKIKDNIIISNEAIQRFISNSKLHSIWQEELGLLDKTAISQESLQNVSQKICTAIDKSEFPQDIKKDIIKYYSNLSNFTDSYVTLTFIDKLGFDENYIVAKSLKGIDEVLVEIKSLIKSIFESNFLYQLYKRKISPFNVDMSIFIYKTIACDVSGIINIHPSTKEVTIKTILGCLQPIFTLDNFADVYSYNYDTTKCIEIKNNTQDWMLVSSNTKKHKAGFIKIDVSQKWKNKQKLDEKDINILVHNIKTYTELCNDTSDKILYWGYELGCFYVINIYSSSDNKFDNIQNTEENMFVVSDRLSLNSESLNIHDITLENTNVDNKSFITDAEIVDASNAINNNTNESIQSLEKGILVKENDKVQQSFINSPTDVDNFINSLTPQEKAKYLLYKTPLKVQSAAKDKFTKVGSPMKNPNAGISSCIMPYLQASVFKYLFGSLGPVSPQESDQAQFDFETTDDKQNIQVISEIVNDKSSNSINKHNDILVSSNENITNVIDSEDHKVVEQVVSEVVSDIVVDVPETVEAKGMVNNVVSEIINDRKSDSSEEIEVKGIVVNVTPEIINNDKANDIPKKTEIYEIELPTTESNDKIGESVKIPNIKFVSNDSPINTKYLDLYTQTLDESTINSNEIFHTKSKSLLDIPNNNKSVFFNDTVKLKELVTSHKVYLNTLIETTIVNGAYIDDTEIVNENLTTNYPIYLNIYQKNADVNLVKVKNLRNKSNFKFININIADPRSLDDFNNIKNILSTLNLRRSGSFKISVNLTNLGLIKNIAKLIDNGMDIALIDIENMITLLGLDKKQLSDLEAINKSGLYDLVSEIYKLSHTEKLELVLDISALTLSSANLTIFIKKMITLGISSFVTNIENHNEVKEIIYSLELHDFLT